MTELISKNDNTIGFVDPYVIFKEPNPSSTWINDMCTNLMRFFMNQKYKRRILFPYNFN
jgi:hypothetical protein